MGNCGSPGEDVDLSIVITTWNTRELLQNCLNSVCRNTKGLVLEVIVIDDGSQDGTMEMLRERFPQVIARRNEENLGYAVANNQGISLSRGQYVLLLNSDTLVLGDSLRRMVSYLEEHPSVGAVGPRLLNADGSLQRSCWPFPSAWRQLLDSFFMSHLLHKLHLMDDYRNWPQTEAREVDWIVSAALLVRQDVFTQVGLFDTNLFVYGVETEWSVRARAKGWRFVALADAPVVHLGGQSGLHRLGKMLVDGMWSHDYFFMKHRGRASLAVCKALLILGYLLRIAVWSAIWGATRDKNMPGRIRLAANIIKWNLGILKRRQFFAS